MSDLERYYRSLNARDQTFIKLVEVYGWYQCMVSTKESRCKQMVSAL